MTPASRLQQAVERQVALDAHVVSLRSQRANLRLLQNESYTVERADKIRELRDVILAAERQAMDAHIDVDKILSEAGVRW